MIYEGFQADGCVVDENEPVLKFLSGTPRPRPATAQGASIRGIDEWVSIDSMMRTAAVLAVFMAPRCGTNRIG